MANWEKKAWEEFSEEDVEQAMAECKENPSKIVIFQHKMVVFLFRQSIKSQIEHALYVDSFKCSYSISKQDKEDVVDDTSVIFIANFCRLFKKGLIHYEGKKIFENYMKKILREWHTKAAIGQIRKENLKMEKTVSLDNPHCDEEGNEITLGDRVYQTDRPSLNIMKDFEDKQLKDQSKRFFLSPEKSKGIFSFDEHFIYVEVIVNRRKYEEIAEVLGISISGVSRIVKVIEKKLKKYLAKEGYY